MHKKSPARLWAAGLYKGWVSKHNPCTILKRKFSTKKLFLSFLRHTPKDVDKLSTIMRSCPSRCLSGKQEINETYTFIIVATNETADTITSLLFQFHTHYNRLPVLLHAHRRALLFLHLVLQLLLLLLKCIQQLLCLFL